MSDIISIEKTVLPSHARRAVHLNVISRAIKGEYVVSGGYVQQHASVADMSVDVDAISSYRYGGSDLSLSAATVVIEAADEELHRIDILYIDAAGALTVAKGTEGEAVAESPGSTAVADWLTWTSPSPPDMSSTPGVILAEILVPAGKTQIIDDYIRMLGQPGIGVTGAAGADGADGATILSGADDPTTEGNDGDWYIQTTDMEIWGPKAAGAWPVSGTPISITGSAGTSILYGTVDPTTEGNDGDWYIQTTDNELWGPKASGAWPASGVSLIGPTGPAYSPDHDLLTNLGHDAHPQYVLRSLLTEQGCIPIRGATVWEKLGPGVAGQILTFMGSGASPILANPIWQNYAPNASFERWTTGLLDGGWVQDSGATVEIVDGAYDGFDGMFGVKITSGGSGAEGINVALTRLKPSTTYYVRVWMKPAAGDTAAAWTVGAATELDISSTESGGEFVTGSFVTGATPGDITIHLGQETSGDMAEYDMLTVTELPAPMYISSEHAYMHHVGGRDEISHSLIDGLLEDDHPQYLLLNGRSLGQVICGGTGASEALTLASTYNATKGKIYLGALGQVTIDELNGRLGIGVTAPTVALDIAGKINMSGTVTDVSSSSVTIARKFAATDNLALTFNGIFLKPLIDIANGKTLTGSISSHTAYALRNMSGDGGNAGTLVDLIGHRIWYGHYNAAAISPVTANAYGVYVAPFHQTGTITNMYDLYLAAETSGGTVTNKWGIYQANSKLNCFAGNIYTAGDVSAATFTDRTEAFIGDALDAVSKIKATESGEIDHSTLPEFALMPYQDENQEWWPGRSVNGMVSVHTKALQEVSALLAAKDEQIAALETRMAAIEARL